MPIQVSALVLTYSLIFSFIVTYTHLSPQIWLSEGWLTGILAFQGSQAKSKAFGLMAFVKSPSLGGVHMTSETPVGADSPWVPAKTGPEVMELNSS